VFRVCRIFCVDKDSRNGGGQAVEESAEGVKVNVAEKFLGETRSPLSPFSGQKILLDNNCEDKSKLENSSKYMPLVSHEERPRIFTLYDQHLPSWGG